MCLSGSELYSRWVPLNIAEREGGNESEQNFPKCFKVFKIVILTRN